MSNCKDLSFSSSSCRCLCRMVVAIVILLWSQPAAYCSLTAAADEQQVKKQQQQQSLGTSQGEDHDVPTAAVEPIDYLYALSDEELEEICTVRGFELVKDDNDNDAGKGTGTGTTGDSASSSSVFTHDDYVEAARQCLAIEQDMEEIIAEHPEIITELEKERERMIAERDRLEEELAKHATTTTTTPTTTTTGEEEELTTMIQEEEQHHALDVQHNYDDEDVMDLDVVVSEQQQQDGIAEFDNDFDVVGHQEPISDSRVHEEGGQDATSSRMATEQQHNDEEEASTVVARKDNHDNNVVDDERNPFVPSLGGTIQDIRRRIVRDVTFVVDVIFPKSMRGPTKRTLRRVGRLTKETAIQAYHFVLRYVRALVETRRANQQQQGEDDDEEDTGMIGQEQEQEGA